MEAAKNNRAEKLRAEARNIRDTWNGSKAQAERLDKIRRELMEIEGQDAAADHTGAHTRAAAREIGGARADGRENMPRMSRPYSGGTAEAHRYFQNL